MRAVTLTILIGNSDDKLGQAEWTSFIRAVRHVVQRSGEVHFDGFSPLDAAWQNACFVVEINMPGVRHTLQHNLQHIAAKYRQDSIAVVSGTTEFVRAPSSLTSPIYYCRCAVCKSMFESPDRDAMQCVICRINGEWLHSQWTIVCAGEIADEGTLFNRLDQNKPVKD